MTGDTGIAAGFFDRSMVWISCASVQVLENAILMLEKCWWRN